MKVFLGLLLLAAQFSFGQLSSPGRAQAQNPVPQKHFERVLVIVLENQAYASAIHDKYLKQLADDGVEFTDFRALGHPSYPNYLAMIAGSTFGIHGLLGD